MAFQLVYMVLFEVLCGQMSLLCLISIKTCLLIQQKGISFSLLQLCQATLRNIRPDISQNLHWQKLLDIWQLSSSTANIYREYIGLASPSGYCFPTTVLSAWPRWARFAPQMRSGNDQFPFSSETGDCFLPEIFESKNFLFCF